MYMTTRHEKKNDILLILMHIEKHLKLLTLEEMKRYLYVYVYEILE